MGGVYQLWLWVPDVLRIRVGALGECVFPPGWYVYTGRAERGLAARVRRHHRLATTGQGALHWHIDYLLFDSRVELSRVRLVSGDAGEECAAVRRLRGEVVVAGFGSSDCREGCGAHLLRCASPALNRS